MSKVLQLEGDRELIGRLQASRGRSKPLMSKVLVRIAEKDIFPETQRQVPVDTGKLRGTGFVRKIDGGAELGYGPGGAEAYAKVQHERTDFRHYGSGKAKYVEDPMKAAGAKLPSQVKREVTSFELFGRSAL